jgi:hypothetical protein
MANELTVSCSVRFSKAGREASKSYAGIQIDVTGDKVTQLIQEIGTTEEALDIGDIGTAGYVIMKNLDAENFIEIRPGSGTADLIKLKAGEVAMFRLALNGPYAIADTAACDLEMLLIES